MARTQYTRNIPNDEFLAIINANNPSATNPFVTVTDLLNTTNITTVQNHSALPDPTTVAGKFYYCVESEGTRWKLFQLLGGTWKPNGLYYSDGVFWTTTPVPFQATQAEVDAGTNNTEFVTPNTLNLFSKWLTKLDKALFEAQNEVTKEPTGYPNRVDTTFYFDDGTRTFTIEPIGASYAYWTQGTEHIITTPKTIALPNITGKYFVYFDDTETLGYTVTFDDSLLNDKVFTVVVYYNATTGKGEFLLDERHGLTMDWATHFHLHNAFGTRYYGGFGLFYIIGDGSLDSHAQLALGTGTIADEDIPTTIVDSPSPSAFFEQVLSPIALIPTVYKLSVSEWQKDTATNYPFKIVSGIPQYNLDTLGVHTLENVTNGYYFTVWIFAINEVNTPIISVLGSREDSTLAAAKNNNTYGTIDWGDLPSQEYKALYRLIYKYDTSFTNTTKVALAEVDDLRGAVDAVLNSSTLNPVADHGSLIGLGDDDHLQYFNQTRGDARYAQLIHTHTASQITDFDTEVSNNTDVTTNTAKLSALKTKSGVIPGASFAGNPKKFTLNFGTAFSDANYSISIVGNSSRSWSIDAGQTASQVVINANANTVITGNVYWVATKHGEN